MCTVWIAGGVVVVGDGKGTQGKHLWVGTLVGGCVCLDVCEDV